MTPVVSPLMDEMIARCLFALFVAIVFGFLLDRALARPREKGDGKTEANI